MTRLKALALFLPVTICSLAQAESVPKPALVKEGMLTPLPTKRIKQKDGSVVIRLALPKRGLPKALASNPRPAAKHDQRDAQIPSLGGMSAKAAPVPRAWLDAFAEPRFMTALAAVAMEPGLSAKNMNTPLDPALVRHWAEFVDPSLYLYWQGVDAKYSQAILKQVPYSTSLAQAGLHPIGIMIPSFAQAGAPLAPTLWSNAFGTGPSGQDAAREWLKLPMPDPRSNPWLSNHPHYRY